MDTDELNIPKVIHYCWFGKKDKPKLIKKCIEGWGNVLKDYVLIEWNEDNFDINCNDYVKEAYEAGKYAFVSDFVRVYALYNFGGIYLDTDVEVVKSFDNLLSHRSFWGFEEKNYLATSTIGAEKGNEIIKEFLDMYSKRKFIKENGEYDTYTNVGAITELLRNHDVILDGSYQEFKWGVVYPQRYLSPYDYINCINNKTEDTVTVHHYYKSWLPLYVRLKTQIKKILVRIIGTKGMEKIRRLIVKLSKNGVKV